MVRRMKRWLVVLMLGTACGAGAPPPQSPVSAPPAGPEAESPEPQGQGPGQEPGVEGAHVTAEVVYKRDCAPPGSRGGCHTITLHPDGRYTEWLYDAVTGGTYTIDGDQVALSGATPELDRVLTLSADRTQLGEFQLEE